MMENYRAGNSHRMGFSPKTIYAAPFAILDYMSLRVGHPSGPLISIVVLFLAAAGFNTYFAFPLLPTWYAGLIKPVSLPVDTFTLIMVVLITYLLLGGSILLIWHASHMKEHDRLLFLAFLTFAIILIGLWGYLFFGLKSPFMGILDSVFVIAMLLATMIQAVRVSFGATLLLTIVVILTFLIAYINYLIIVFNPSLPLFGI